MKEAFQFISETFSPVIEGAKKGADKHEMRSLVEEAIEKAQERAAEGKTPKAE